MENINEVFVITKITNTLGLHNNAVTKSIHDDLMNSIIDEHISNDIFK